MFTTDIPRAMRKQRGLDIFNRMCEDGEKGTVKFDDLDCAILGTGQQHGSRTVLVYSASLILAALMEDHSWEMEEAQEWFGFNIECLYAGPGTPIIVHDLDWGDY